MISLAESVEFCFEKSKAYSLVKENVDKQLLKSVIKTVSSELAALPVKTLISLCESVPKIRLYVPTKLFNEMVQNVLGKNQDWKEEEEED